VVPAVQAFEFSVTEGTFWEFAWSRKTNSWVLGTNSSSTDGGFFRLRLGSPRIIDGMTAYRLEVEVSSVPTPHSPRWSYLAFDEHRIFGSQDGFTLKTVFDGARGNWPGGGLFHRFPDDEVITARAGTDSRVVEGATIQAIIVGRSFAEGQCEYYPEIGTICPGDRRESADWREYYDPTVGPYGFYSRSTTSSSISGASSETRCVLLNLSLDGTGQMALELEPNDNAVQAHPLAFDTPIIAYAQTGDSGTVVAASPEFLSSTEQLGVILVDAVFSDWYSFDVDSSRSVTVSLAWDPWFVDLDLALFDASAQRVLGASLTDNFGDRQSGEVITVSLSPGRYYAAVIQVGQIVQDVQRISTQRFGLGSLNLQGLAEKCLGF